MRPILRSLAYLWAGPNTLLGLILLPTVLFGSRVRIVRGVVEIHGPAVRMLFRLLTGRRLDIAAMTLGHSIVGINQASLDVSRDHEHVHVRQYERWGPLFIPVYFLASLVAWSRGGSAYRDNVFEIEAFRQSHSDQTRRGQ